jgi:hypothetical protein
MIIDLIARETRSAAAERVAFIRFRGVDECSQHLFMHNSALLISHTQRLRDIFQRVRSIIFMRVCAVVLLKLPAHDILHNSQRETWRTEMASGERDATRFIIYLFITFARCCNEA